MTTNINHLVNARNALNELNAHQVIVGIPADNDFLNMIALVQEMGKHIQSKNYPYLVIPTGNAQGRKTSEIVGLYRRGHALGIDDDSQPYGFKVMFVLKKSVDIPSRPFIRYTQDHYQDNWTSLLNDCVMDILMERKTPKDVYKVLGEQMVSDMQKTLDNFSDPKNAPLTENRKGFNNPLIDTKRLRNSITYMVIKK